MNLDAHQVRLSELILKKLEGNLPAQEQNELITILRSSRQAVHYYNEMIILYSGLATPCKVSLNINTYPSSQQSDNFLLCMAQVEKESPALIVEKPKLASSNCSDETSGEKTVRKINKTSLFVAMASLAALVFLVLFAKYLQAPSGIEVATLTDSIKARWGTSPDSKENGFRLIIGHTPLVLQEGIIELSFDNAAKVVIEAPAEFQILAEDKINLQCGKLYATVPSKAIGFMITTQSTKVIDLGTEFGVQTSFNGTTELHVYKGKTTLIAGVSQDSKKVVELVAGKAARTRSDSSQIMDIGLNETLFVREIDSSKQLIWHGQPLDLASVVAGGDGFSQEQTARGIDPATGEIHTQLVQELNRLGNNAYRSVKGQSGIDGVFVPNGALGATVVSSAGHTFAFPQTDDMYYADITSYPYVHKLFPPSDIALSLSPLTTGKTPDSPLIFIHSSAGITFNLDEIRQSLGNLEIDRFKSSCGTSYDGEVVNRSEFWVLIDGQCVFHYTFDQDHREVGKIDVSITPQQKFLTLATTYGGDNVSGDWCIFDKPQLVFAKKQQEVRQANHDAGVEK